MRSWRKGLGRLRLLAYATLLILAGLFVWRFDRIRLPREGCSPLWDFAPGDLLVVDVRAGAVSSGDAVFFRGRAGELLLGRVSDPPRSAPESTWKAWSAGHLWIVGERSDCPGTDSRVLGPLPPSAVVGRVALALPW